MDQTNNSSSRRCFSNFSALLGLAALSAPMAMAQHSEVTYNGDVAEIINENCVVCHREGGIGPMQLTNYEQVRPWAPLIQLRVANREMPPYAYDQHIGIQDLKGDWRLEQEEIDTIIAWVNAGSPLGDSDIVPTQPDFPDPDEWNFAAELGQPDLIIPSIAIDIPATGNDMWHKHYVATGVEEKRCIQAMQVKPRGDARAVVHHSNPTVETLDPETGEFERYSQLTEYAMGKWGELIPEGVCRVMPPDSRIFWDIHMFPGGVGATAQGEMIEDNVVELGIWFHDEDFAEQENVYEQDLRAYQMREGYENGMLVIPPNGYAMTQGFHSFDHPVRIDSFQPHGHLRMNAAALEIFNPETGQTTPISQISNWSATWHHSHIYESDVAPLLPAGHVLVIKQWYDNTSGNPNNPDPDQWVYDGSRTGDEMSHAWIAVTHFDEEGFEKLLAERQARDERAVAGND
jgi:mono/diheme cytochrome c family protein